MSSEALDKDVNYHESLNPCRRLDFEKEHDDNPTSNQNFEAKTPRIGMEFNSEEEAYHFYNAYARGMGFGIRRATVNFDLLGKVVYRKFCCSCEGIKRPDKRDASRKSCRPSTRTDCGAYMLVNARYTRKFQVVEFVAEHKGHKMVSPNKVHLFRSHRTITGQQGVEIEHIDESGIRPKAGLTLMSKQVGGRENLGYTLSDLKYYLRSKRSIPMQEGDAGGLLSYLRLKQSEDPSFFNAIQLDEDDLITNIFWADGQMKNDYACFGDVVCFDTTFKTNNEGRRFALFVGVNHHKQTVVFGGAFLYDETIETFKWLFDTFAEAMNGKKPLTILTDQDAAMANALAESWSNTCHRLCIWHIYQNAAKNLKEVFANHPDFRKDFSYCIYGYDEEVDFIDGWHQMLDKYQLQTNDWLERMFRKKEQWALVYGRQTFCGDMISTQRSESMNSVLKQYVSYRQHFDRLVDDRRYEELKVEFTNKQSTIELAFEVSILKHARDVYTQKVFVLFQEEVRKSFDSKLDSIGQEESTWCYKYTPPSKRYHHIVTYDSSDCKIICSCKKFEFAGILCSHALKVLSIHSVLTIPDLYIKKRWTKCARMGIEQPLCPSNKSSESAVECENRKFGERYRSLCRMFSQLATRAARADETFEFAKSLGEKGLEKIDTMFETEQISKPNLRPGYVVKKALVSRITKKPVHVSVELENQVIEPPFDVENTSSMADQNASSEVVIMGIKKKQVAKEKSGKRLKSGLERSTSRRKTKLNKSLPKTCENDARNLNIVDHGSIKRSLPQVFSCPPMLPQSSQLACPSMMPVAQAPPQIANWIQPSWSTSFPRVDGALTLLQPSQLVNQDISEQVSSHSRYGSIYQQQLQVQTQVFRQQQLQMRSLNQQNHLNDHR